MIWRSFCCLFYNANTECANRCAGRECTEQCNTFCGITNSLCGSMTCSSVTSNCVTTTTTTTSTSTSCTPLNESCSADPPCCTGTCMPNTNITLGLTCQQWEGGDHCLSLNFWIILFFIKILKYYSASNFLLNMKVSDLRVVITKRPVCISKFQTLSTIKSMMIPIPIRLVIDYVEGKDKKSK